MKLVWRVVWILFDWVYWTSNEIHWWSSDIAVHCYRKAHEK